MPYANHNTQGKKAENQRREWAVLHASLDKAVLALHRERSRGSDSLVPQQVLHWQRKINRCRQNMCLEPIAWLDVNSKDRLLRKQMAPAN